MVDSGTCKKSKRTDLEKLNANNPQSTFSDRRGAEVSSEVSPLASVGMSAVVLAKTGNSLTCGEGSRACGPLPQPRCSGLRLARRRAGPTLQAAAEAMGAQARGPRRPRITQGGPRLPLPCSPVERLPSSERCVGRPPRAVGANEEPCSPGRTPEGGPPSAVASPISPRLSSPERGLSPRPGPPLPCSAFSTLIIAHTTAS